jgi:hypothetical protein
MKRHAHTFVAVLAALTIVSLNIAPAEAGGCGSGRGRIGISFGHGRVGIGVSRAPSHRVLRPYVPSHVAPAQPVYAQPVYSQPTLPNAAPPAIGQQPIQQPAQAPSTSSQPQSLAQQVPGKSGPAATPQSNEASALQLLASIAGEEESTSSATTSIPEFTPASTPTASPHTGSWKVSLPGNQQVELALNANGSFRWTATRDGKSTSFEGQYRLESGRLTLVRSGDLQQMAGTWTGQGSNFTFKLDGATNSGLAFVRS